MTDAGRTVLKSTIALAVMLTACALKPMGARAQAASTSTDTGNGLINVATPDILAPRQWGARADLRVFGGDENTTYFGLGVRYGLSNNWEVGIGSSMAQFENFTISGGGGTIRHGGTDVELAAKYNTHQTGVYGLSGQIGVGMPNTPAQKTAHITAGITGSMSAGSSLDFYVNPRTVLVTNNTIVGLGFGARVKITNQVSIVGDYTAIIGGANTIDTSTGNQRSHDVYGAALRYSTRHGSIGFDLGYTNGTGFTTGSSLTSGLGSSGAFYVALNLKR